MKSKVLGKNVCVILACITLMFLAFSGCASHIRPDVEDPDKCNAPVIEKNYSDDAGKISIGIANTINRVSSSGLGSIEENKKRVLQMIDEFKKYKVNMVLLPEFSLTGYFWDNSTECWNYMREGVTDRHLSWLHEVKSKLDDNLKYIIFNNIRSDPNNPDGKFFNSTYVVDKDFDWENLYSESNERFRIYDKTFLHGIENAFTTSGKTDILILETEWGNFGFTTCYDMCFTQVFQGYAMIDKVDAIVQIASWRGSSKREYPGMDVSTDSYFGFIWDLMASSLAAFNQVWIFASNAVGKQERGDYEFWGGSGVWAPSGVTLIQASNKSEELIVVRNIDIKGQNQFERDNFDYYKDFTKIYHEIEKLRSFSRMLK